VWTLWRSDGGGGCRGGRGTESYDRNIAWHSINRSILSDFGKAIMSIPLELRMECGLCGGLMVGDGGGACL
jgi:hypothetical protein